MENQKSEQDIDRRVKPESGLTDVFWEDIVAEYFPDSNIDDLSDIDRTSSRTFYVALDGGPPFADETFDAYNESQDVYYMEIEISEDETLVCISFLKYEKGGFGQSLYVEEYPFKPEHDKEHARALKMFRETGLKPLTYCELAAKADMDGQIVSVYYKYFTQASDDPLYAPEVGRVE